MVLNPNRWILVCLSDEGEMAKSLEKKLFLQPMTQPGMAFSLLDKLP
jgi:hypothetical protein